MLRDSAALPQLDDRVMLSDSGLETDLIFNQGLELPEFASFPLMRDAAGIAILERYFTEHAAVAASADLGVVFETPTWRANEDWGKRLGWSPADLRAVNRDAVTLVAEVGEAFPAHLPFVVSGNLGPRGDAYRPESAMTAEEARDYHRDQVEAFAEAGARLVTAMTLTYVDEGVGIAEAARDAGLPVVLSFTVETDGALPDGTPLRVAVAEVDETTDGYPAYFMLNCAHPDHFVDVLDPGAAWTQRLRGLRSNASRMSHAELDEAEELDPGDPDELAASYAAIRSSLPQVTVLGGCCGTDLRHVAAIARACG